MRAKKNKEKKKWKIKFYKNKKKKKKKAKDELRRQLVALAGCEESDERIYVGWRHRAKSRVHAEMSKRIG